MDALGKELAALNETAAQATAKKVQAAAAFQKAVGYAAEVDGILRAGNDLASKATKAMTTQPAASFLLGYGAINYRPIVAAAPSLGVEWLIVEQDTTHRPPLESIGMSIKWLREHTA